MRARQLISDASYGPDRIIYQAFDGAWESIVENFGDNRQEIETVRTKLARIILSFPHNEIRDAEQIKNSSLRIMALAYRKWPA